MTLLPLNINWKAMGVACLLSIFGCGDVLANDLRHAFIFVNDDSGMLQNKERASQLRTLALAQLRSLEKKRKYANAQFIAISTSYAKPVFVGNVKDLSGNRAQALVDKLEPLPDRCNQLAESFTAVDSTVRNLEQQGFASINIYIFSSLISTPNPCKAIKSIALPQLPVPVDFKAKLTRSKAVKTIAFYYVNPHQIRVYQDVLGEIEAWGYEAGNNFAMFDVEGSDHALRHNLLGVTK